MYYITQEQANALYEFAKHKTVKGERFNNLLAEIAMHVPTHGDKWRSMTDEQIAKIIQRDGCATCPASEICEQETAKLGSVTEMAFNKLCKVAIVKWLKLEAKENDTH